VASKTLEVIVARAGRLGRRAREWAARHPEAVWRLNVVRLGLFQFGVGLSLVLLTGTLNRVLIAELGIAAAVVTLLVALHLFVAPVRALIGFRSDRSRSRGRWRTPYIVLGAMLTFGGLACAPFALILLSGEGTMPYPAAFVACTLIFLCYGVGMHIVQTAYLALVTDLTPPEQRGEVLAVLWVMLVVGMILSALAVGYLLLPYDHIKLVRVLQGSAAVFIFLTALALIGQERINAAGFVVSAGSVREIDLTFGAALAALSRQPLLRRLFAILFLGVAALSAQDVLLEPYGAQVLGMSVPETTRLTALWGFGMLVAIVVVGLLLKRGAAPGQLLAASCLVGMAGFVIIAYASSASRVLPFHLGVWTIGLANGGFVLASLALVMGLTDPASTGFFLGIWGLTQALGQGAGNLFGGIARDLVLRSSGDLVAGYTFVYEAEVVGLLLTVALLAWLRPSRLLHNPAARAPWTQLTDIPQ
jgi:MFS transporter, BCD family, chlorophyll transporter